jgi:CheY-like chemotaxis protein
LPVQPATNDEASRSFSLGGLPRYEPGSALILIGEDHESSRVALRRMLVSEGYAVEEAEDGAEVLAKYALCRPNLILLDALMPKLDGFQVCATLQTLPRGSTKLHRGHGTTTGHPSTGLEAGADRDQTVHWPILQRYAARPARARARSSSALPRTPDRQIPDYLHQRCDRRSDQ